MLIRVYEETQLTSESPKASVGFQYNEKDAPDIVIYNCFSRWKLILILLKAAWVILTSKDY